MPEIEPQGRPIETDSGKLIVYIILRDSGVYVECPALGYNLGIPHSSYNEESVRHSFETVIRSVSTDIVRRAGNGEPLSEERVGYAQRCANGTPKLPLVYIQETEGNHGGYH